MSTCQHEQNEDYLVLKENLGTETFEETMAEACYSLQILLEFMALMLPIVRGKPELTDRMKRLADQIEAKMTVSQREPQPPKPRDIKP